MSFLSCPAQKNPPIPRFVELYEVFKVDPGHKDWSIHAAHAKALVVGIKGSTLYLMDSLAGNLFGQTLPMSCSTGGWPLGGAWWCCTNGLRSLSSSEVGATHRVLMLEHHQRNTMSCVEPCNSSLKVEPQHISLFIFKPCSSFTGEISWNIRTLGFSRLLRTLFTFTVAEKNPSTGVGKKRRFQASPLTSWLFRSNTPPHASQCAVCCRHKWSKESRWTLTTEKPHYCPVWPR